MSDSVNLIVTTRSALRVIIRDAVREGQLATRRARRDADGC